ncbi:hypothetical protein J4231_03450 [Candidatus Woesearchaeota archaeon]|nr:hypothetical protein [Candidatus Woesearchaeota archaeon]
MFKRILFMLLLAINIASAATIQGIVYDLSLNPVDKSIVEVNSIPQQRYVSQDGKYSLSLPKGSYMITAKYNDNLAAENITIADDGIYNLDLFLFPLLDEDITEDINIDIQPEKSNYLPYMIAFIALIAISSLVLLLYYIRKKKHANTQINPVENESLVDDKQKILDIIKKQGNRTTQKDIRKEISLSEAKVSLVIAELEHESKVKKIKKGRGNIIIIDDSNNKSH